MKEIVLYQKGSHITDITIQHKARICIMSGGAGGEHCTYIDIESEESLLKALRKNHYGWFRNLFPFKQTSNTKKEIVGLLAVTFKSNTKDPSVEIDRFFKKHGIETKSEYWPDR